MVLGLSKKELFAIEKIPAAGDGSQKIAAVLGVLRLRSGEVIVLRNVGRPRTDVAVRGTGLKSTVKSEELRVLLNRACQRTWAGRCFYP